MSYSLNDPRSNGYDERSVLDSLWALIQEAAMKELSSTLKQFCENAELLRLAYTDSKGYPRVVPVWFVILD